MLENSRALNSIVFKGVLSKFPKLKTSVFRIAGRQFIRWVRVIRSLSNLYLNCNHCKHYFAHILNSRQHGEKNNFEQFVYKRCRVSATQAIHRTVRKILHLPNEMNPLMLRKLKSVSNRRNTLRRSRSRR